MSFKRFIFSFSLNPEISIFLIFLNSILVNAVLLIDPTISNKNK